MPHKPEFKMKQLTKFQSALFLIGGILLVVGTGLYVFQIVQHVACWIGLAGALLFAFMQLMQRYEGSDFVVRRLRRIVLLSDFLFVISGFLMVESQYRFLLPFFDNVTVYIQYIYNKWIITLLIAAILQLYTGHRLSNELKKENKR